MPHLNGTLFFGFTVANLMGRTLAEACGIEAQAVALVDGLGRINALVRERTRTVALRLHLGFVPGFCLLMRLKAGLGFPPDPGRVFGTGVGVNHLMARGSTTIRCSERTRGAAHVRSVVYSRGRLGTLPLEQRAPLPVTTRKDYGMGCTSPLDLFQ